MELKPSENIKLYGMSRYFNEISKLYNKEILPTKILLSGKKGLGKSTLAYHIINYILSSVEVFKYDSKNYIINENNRSFKLMQNNSHPNFYLIDLLNEKKKIDVAQIREMITYTNKSSFNNKERLILIDNVESLNKSSVNALLKIIEEPNDNIFFILINNSEKNILPTLSSRCLTFKINFTFSESVNVSNLILDNNILDLINYDLISFYNTPGQIVDLVNFSKEKNIDLKNQTLINFLNLLIDNGYYKKSKLVKNLLINFIELFFLKEYKLRNKKNSLLEFYYIFLNKIHNTEKFNLDEEALFMEFKSKLL
jgi:DNA polymerase-3 subunit delta'